MTRQSIQELLHTTFDGDYVSDPDDVINDGLDDLRYRERLPGLRALLSDPDTEPFDRFLAVSALASWGEADGFKAIADAAAQGSAAPWYESLIDSRFSVDETFSQLAAAIVTGVDMAAEKGTEADRVAALRALVKIADEHFFDWHLAFALTPQTLPAVLDDLVATIRRGIGSLKEGTRPSFDVGTQLADLIAAITPVDEPLAVDLGMELARTAPSTATLKHLAAVVSHGRAPRSREFAEYLGMIGDDEVRTEIATAMSRRADPTS